jgi:hypothetical protein
MAEGNWAPLGIMLIIFFTIALLINLVGSSFDYDLSHPDYTNPVSNSTLFVFIHMVLSADTFDTLDTGFEVFGFDVPLPIFNPFSMLGEDVQDFALSELNVWSYVPATILYPFFILFALAFVWSVIKLLPFG